MRRARRDEWRQKNIAGEKEDWQWVTSSNLPRQRKKDKILSNMRKT
jgi:hypothetical protein